MIQFNKIIKKINETMEDFFVCDCLIDDLFSFLVSEEKIRYNDIISKLEEKKPANFLFFNLFGVSILMCKCSFFHYRKIRKDNFIKITCCPEFFMVDGVYATVCCICLAEDIVTNSNLNFFKHFRLVDRFRKNGIYLYMQLPIRTFTENVLL